MPGYRAHMAAGAAVFGVTLAGVTHLVMPQPTIFLALQWLLSSILGSLFPDVDTKSMGQIIFYQVIAVTLFFLWWQNQIGAFMWVTFLAMLPVLANHRGLFHKPWFILLFSFGGAFLCAQSYPTYQTILLLNALFFSVGAFSHIYLDRIVTFLKKKFYY